MKKRMNAIALAVAATLLSMGTATAREPVSLSAAENGRLWFVELAGAPVADGNSTTAVRNEQAAFRRAAAAAGLRYSERRSFDTLFNGFSVAIDPRDVAKLSQISGVKAIYPVATIEAPSPQRTGGSASADMVTALAMTGAQIAQASGYTGKGVKVGVIDTGIDLDHPDFGGSGVNGATPLANHPRIPYGYDFVGDAYNAAGSGSALTPVPDGNPDDCNGHGTHVAGIVGASGAIKGVAPEVTFGAYRVFGCEGSSSADVIIAAMERALADGMQVVNQSLGAAFQWPQYPTAQAADRLVRKGVTMVASTGNSGANGLYSAGAPGVAKEVIAVASYDNTNLFVDKALLNGTTTAPHTPLTNAPPAPKSGTSAEIVYAGRGCTVDTPLADVAGKVALVTRGACSFNEKYVKAQAAGAVGVIIENNVPGDFFGTLGNPSPTFQVFGIGVSQATGAAIKAAPAGRTLTWTAETVNVANPTGGLISSFSSYGLTPDLQLKPNIGAPGGFIYSTYPLEAGGYATLSGTSMSSPHVAGVAALVLQADPKVRGKQMKARLQNHADPKNWSGNPGLGFLDFAHRQGAGMVDTMASIGSTSKVEPSELSLGESQAGPVTQTLTVRNDGSSPLTFNIGHVPALSSGPNTFTVGAATGFAAVTPSATTLTVPAKGSASVDVTIAANSALSDRSIYGGYITLTQSDDATKVLRVPYAGFKGDYQAVPVMTSGGVGFPLLGWTPDGVNFGIAGAGDTFTLQGFDQPQFLVHLDHPSQTMRLEAFEAVSGRTWHRVSELELLPRNSTSTGFFAFSWDGTTFRGNGRNASQQLTAPNGSYVVKISVLRALGDESNPDHWETWTSPAFNIQRP